MFSLKDKYILGYISAIWVYLVFRAYHTSSFYSDYDCILLTIILFGGWFIVCNYRMFTMTRRKLYDYYGECDLQYKSYEKNNLVNRIFVKPMIDDDWYELDYILTIPRNCTKAEFKEFAMKNNTVSKLLRTMDNMEDAPGIKRSYQLMKIEYNTTRWVLLFSLIMFYFLYSLVHYETLMY